MIVAPHYHIHLIIIITTAITFPIKKNSREVYTDDRSWRRTYQVHAPSVPAKIRILMILMVMEMVMMVVMMMVIIGYTHQLCLRGWWRLWTIDEMIDIGVFTIVIMLNIKMVIMWMIRPWVRSRVVGRWDNSWRRGKLASTDRVIPHPGRHHDDDMDQDWWYWPHHSPSNTVMVLNVSV